MPSSIPALWLDHAWRTAEAKRLPRPRQCEHDTDRRTADPRDTEDETTRDHGTRS